MEIMILNEGLQRSFSELKQVNPGILAEQITKSPEDYVFILSVPEWKQWLELHIRIGKELRAIKNSDEWWKRLWSFVKENEGNLSCLISAVSALPSVGNSFKIGTLTQNALGDCYAIFFAKPNQEQKRSHKVMEEILRFKAEQLDKHPNS